MVGKAVCVSRSVRSSDCFAILRNLLETHTAFPAGRPADAKEDLNLGLLCNPAESIGQARLTKLSAS